MDGLSINGIILWCDVATTVRLRERAIIIVDGCRPINDKSDVRMGLVDDAFA
jgi:hypothetical protein